MIAHSYFVGEPDGRGANHPSILYTLFQLITFDERLRGLNSGEIVGHGDVVRIVCRLVNGLGRYAMRLFDGGEVVVDSPFISEDRTIPI
jgi:hypothetical protein